MKKSILILFTSCTFLFSSAQEENKFKVSLQAGIPETRIGKQMYTYYDTFDKSDLHIQASEIGLVASYSLNNTNYRFRISYQSHDVGSEYIQEEDNFEYRNKVETNYNYIVFAPGFSNSINVDRITLELGIETSFKFRPKFSTDYSFTDAEYDYFFEDYVYTTDNYSEQYEGQFEFSGGGIFGVNYSIYKNLGFGIEYAPSLSQNILKKNKIIAFSSFGEPETIDLEHSNRSTYIDHRLSFSIRASF